MLTQSLRTAILELHHKGISKRQIAHTLEISRTAVRKVIRSQSAEVPSVVRAEKAEPYRQEILELHASCQGNLVRVHEELVALGVKLSYPALTAFCRRQGIGQKPKVAVGQYHFEPGQEMQHDTSPHWVDLSGRRRLVQTASAVLCYSRMLFFQCYPTFQRFDCKVFLTEALRYFGGACSVVMIDNTHVVVLRGTGAEMVAVPEMVAFAERYSFEFRAHEILDKNRSARVERPFWFIERNFLVGRSFTDWKDLNHQAWQWCDKVNSSYKRYLRAIPKELFAVERPQFHPLPIWTPEVYQLHQRIVDVEGYVTVRTNRYSVPVDWIEHRVEVRETKDRIEIHDGRRKSVSHERVIDPVGQRITISEHRPPRGQGVKRSDPPPEQKAIVQTVPELADYVSALKKRGRKQTTLALRQLLRMVREYPRKPLLAAIQQAAHYGLYDLDRVERMVLKRIAQDYFLIKPNGEDDD